MASELEVRPFGLETTAEVARFIEDASAGGMPAARAELVIREVSAGPEAVLDLWRGGRRVAVAVTVDNCETVGNAAELSVFRTDDTDDEVVGAAVVWAEQRAARAGRSNLDVAPWPGAGGLPGVLVGLGFDVAYRMFHMIRAGRQGPPRATRRPLPPALRWQPASLEFGDAYFATVSAAFADIPGSYVSPREDVLRRLATAKTDSPTDLLIGPDADAVCAGLVRVERRNDGRGEICLLGRHPRYRGLGLGEHLVARGLTSLLDLGCAEQVLEVAAVNNAALHLYVSFGFATAEQVHVYRRPVARSVPGAPG